MKTGKVCRKEYRCGEKMQMETGRAWKSVGTSEKKILRKNRIVVEKDGVQISLPMSDAEMMRLKKPEYCDLFLPMYTARCLVAEAGTADLRGKLPEGVWVQEMNLLAYMLQQFKPQQMECFQKKISEASKMHPGEMLNLALAICPEAAGVEKDSGFCPQYTGENLFDLMEYKRFQDWKREHVSFQIAKFYFPVTVMQTSDPCFDPVELTAAEAAAYQQQISEMIARNLQPDSSWSDWEGYDRLYELAPYKEHSLLYERADVEVWNGELWGVIVAGAGRLLTEKDIEVLKKHFDGGIWDGWGEHSMEVPSPKGCLQLFLSDCTEVRQQAKGELAFTEKEMFLCQSPYFRSRIQMITGWKPDFRRDREYGKRHPVWLELSCNRRSVRVPLPAERDQVAEELKRIQVNPEQRLYIRIKAPDLFPIHDLRLSAMDLPTLNQIAEQVQRMGPEEAGRFHEILLDKNWRGPNRVERIREILERFPEEEKEHKMEPMKVDMRQI